MWSDVIQQDVQALGAELAKRAACEREAGRTIYPPQEQIFRALELTTPEKVKVCLVGQDPYHEAGQANGLCFSVNRGWQNFTQAVFAACAKLPQPIVFITWGGQARAFLAGIPISQLPDKGVVFSSHPSPLGARKGNDVVKAFIGSRPFSQTNRLLEQMGSTPIHWELP